MSYLTCVCILSASLLVLFAVPAVEAADVYQVFEPREHTSGDHKLLYRLMKPNDYDPNKKYPLVLFLHGAGERGDDNKAQLKHGMPEFATDIIRNKFPAFVVAPQCPNNKKWCEVDWGANEHAMPAEPSDPLRLTFEVLEKLQKEFSIDANRLYVTGLSMGGYGTWDCLQRKPGMWAAAMPICGGGDLDGAKAMKDIPIWNFHGDLDGAVKPERSRKMIAAIKAAGGSPKYTEYILTGHDSWVPAYRTPEHYEWLFAQKKK